MPMLEMKNKNREQFKKFLDVSKPNSSETNSTYIAIAKY